MPTLVGRGRLHQTVARVKQRRAGDIMVVAVVEAEINRLDLYCSYLDYTQGPQMFIGKVAL